jgi:hypothetical protein
VHGRPTEDDTEKLLPWFLNAKPSKLCAKGGLGVYNDLIETDTKGLPVGLKEGLVTSAFRAYSTPLSAQADFTGALAASRVLVDSISKVLRQAHSGMNHCYSINVLCFAESVNPLAAGGAVEIMR